MRAAGPSRTRSEKRDNERAITLGTEVTVAHQAYHPFSARLAKKLPKWLILMVITS